MGYKVKQLIMFDVRETIFTISKEVLLADMYGITLHDLGDIVFSTWVDYCKSHQKFWTDTTFNPADHITEYIHEMLYVKIQKGVLPYHVENEFFKIIPPILHASMCLFMTVVALLSRYRGGDEIDLTFDTMNSCDFVVETSPLTLRY